MTDDEIKTLVFCLKWTVAELGGKIHLKKRVAYREGQPLGVNPHLLRFLDIAKNLAERLETKFLPPKPEPGPDDEPDC